MGSHTSYYYLVLELLRFKEELHRVRSPRLQPLIDLLKTKTIKWIDGCEEVQSNKEIAKELGFNVARSNSMMKQLLQKLHEDFDFTPLEITKVIHRVIIMYDKNEYEKLKNSKYGIEYRSMFFDLQLKETPRIGEQIEFEVVPTGIINRGIVHEIRHKVEGKTQIIEIRCHPYKNAYVNWLNMKEEYEEHQRQLKWMKYMNKER